MLLVKKYAFALTILFREHFKHSSDIKQQTAETLCADGKWRNSGLLYANFHGCCAPYLANETELGQNILHTNYWW